MLRVAVGSAQELRSCGTPRGPSGDQPTRPSARGHAAPRGPRARRDALACAHPRDGIPASGTMSSPSAGAGGGAAPLTARSQPRRWARCAPALWSIRRGAASRPAARGTWWSAARHDEPGILRRLSNTRPRRALHRAAPCGGAAEGGATRLCAWPIRNAVAHALVPCGVWVTAMPLTPERPLTLIRTAARPREGPLWSQRGAVALSKGRACASDQPA
jgi:hypothetical protein